MQRELKNTSNFNFGNISENFLNNLSRSEASRYKQNLEKKILPKMGVAPPRPSGRPNIPGKFSKLFLGQAD